VTYSSLVTPAALVSAVEDMGFDASLIATAGQEEAVLAVSGMTCGACSGSVESALRAVPGVSAADVSVITGKAQVSTVKCILPILCWRRHPVVVVHVRCCAQHG
jgi:Cu+-exporting ATPase